MQEIKAEIIKDSISPRGVRLVTVQATYQRFILPEVNTHRMFARNTASSRARPLSKTINDVLSDPAYPVSFGTNQSGMQSGPVLKGPEFAKASDIWHDAIMAAVDQAKKFQELNVHKEVANRILEPFTWTTQIISATEWDNFFKLRIHPDAQPEIQVLARCIRNAMEDSTPQELDYGQWHTPYVDDITWPIDVRLRVSVARCARVSYVNHIGSTEIFKDMQLFDKLTSAVPIHGSPLEHVATPKLFKRQPGNFEGYRQLRHHKKLNHLKGKQ